MKFLSCVAVAGVFFVGTVSAADLYFANTAGDGDLANPVNWGKDASYDGWGSDSFHFGLDVAPTLSKDVSFGKFTTYNLNPAVFKDLSYNIALTGDDMAWTVAARTVFDNCSLIFANGKGGFLSQGQDLVFTNGTKVSMNNRIKFAWSGNSATMVISGEGTDVSATGGNFQFGNSFGKHNTVLINDKATATLASEGALNLGAQGFDNKIVVSGGASLKGGNPLNVGAFQNSSTFTTPDRGENKLIVSNALVQSVGGVNLGRGTYEPSNRIEVVSGGTLLVNGDLSIGLQEPGVKDAEGKLIDPGSFGNVLLVDNAVVTNTGALKIIQGGSNEVRVANNAVFYAGGSSYDAGGSSYVGDKGACNRLTVDGAKEFTCTGTSLIIGNAASSVSNVVTIKDTESLKLPGTVYIGYNGAYGNRMEVSHPTKFAQKVFVGHVNSCDNVLKVVSTEPFADEVCVGPRTTATGNRLVWECDAKYAGSMKLQFYDGINQSGTGCGIELRKIDWDYGAANEGFMFFANSLGCTFKLADGARFTTKGGTNLERGNRIVIDGSTWDACYKNASGSCTVTIGNTGASNVLEVVNGGAFVFTNGSTFAVASTLTPLTNTFNRIIVGDRSKIVIANNFRINRACNEFVISNGTFQFGTEFGFPDMLPGRSPSTIALTNQLVRFYGANPRMVATGANASFPYQESTNLEGETFVRAGYNEFHFDIPAEGYAEPPIECTKADGRVIFGRTHRIFVTGDEFLKNGGRTMLARGNNASIGMTVDDLATLSSALPPKCKLVVKNNNELWLKAPGQGLMILLR